MSTHFRGEELRSTEEIRGFLSSSLTSEMEEARTESDPKYTQALSGFEASTHELIDQIDIKDGGSVDSSELWFRFMEKAYLNNPFLVETIAQDIAVNLMADIRESEDPATILRVRKAATYISSTQILLDASISGRIVSNEKHLREIIDDYFSEIEEDEVSFLREAWGLISMREGFEHSFVIVKATPSKRYALGVEIKDGVLAAIGIGDVTAPCREFNFDTIMDQYGVKDDGSVVLLEITGSFEDVASDWFLNPYILPADLFLLRACTNEKWDGVSLEGTKVSESVESRIK
ncbi:MAG: hypothetical protein ACD_24C00136G0001 [uncultured bacterium]|uniref:Uncharacterized protein n=1 Tax=candidate division WWE3 bacterium RBG_16_37_10 TaxID=1802610 RepID=A0A1F4UWQ7_UNCKA|nr:MAG: hypothetical protein ACD_24C00136G0001 [uncultured bacterium]OGC49374.1 MAG: hypothetical protein A2W32_04230 [candidate division WWE3 bacterium RBG_16_37_10]